MSSALGPVPLRRLFDLDVAAVDLEETVALCHRAVTARERLLIGVLNAAKVVKARHDDFLRDSLLDCDLLLADGQSVVWASRLVGAPLPERVAGIDLFEALLALADREQLRVYLLGAKQEVIDAVVAEIATRWPRAVVAGARNGYFADAESGSVADAVTATRSDLLFLGMTTPKKEIFMSRYAESMGVPVVHGVGGSFDVMAGVTRRAPLRWQKLGLEWAYRLVQEPRRMWKRYLVTNTLFLWMTAGETVRHRVTRRGRR